MKHPAVYGVELDAPERTIILNWGMDASRLATLTGLAPANVRQRKQRLLKASRAHAAEARPITG